MHKDILDASPVIFRIAEFSVRLHFILSGDAICNYISIQASTVKITQTCASI